MINIQWMPTIIIIIIILYLLYTGTEKEAA